jgi:putative membrane protein
MKKTSLLIVLLAALACNVSIAQTATQGSATATTGDTVTTNFISNATIANMKEIATGKMAQSKGKDPSVKAYGNKMVDHHTMATKQMMTIVKAKKIDVPKPPVAMAAPDSMLANSKGDDFDKMYVTMMITDHKNTIALFEKASTSLTDTELKAFAVKTLPMLKQHLTEIQGIASKKNISSTR